MISPFPTTKGHTRYNFPPDLSPNQKPKKTNAQQTQLVLYRPPLIQRFLIRGVPPKSQRFTAQAQVSCTTFTGHHSILYTCFGQQLHKLLCQRNTSKSYRCPQAQRPLAMFIPKASLISGGTFNDLCPRRYFTTDSISASLQ